MKIRFLILTAICLTVASTGFAQPKTAAVTPETVVKNLYAAQKNEKTNPFFQTKSRAPLDKFFTKDFADAIWKDAKDANGEVGTIDFDPLYNTQDDTGLSGLAIKKRADAGSADAAYVAATFKLLGKNYIVDFEVLRQADRTWKINDIIYDNGESLAGLLRLAQNEETRKDYDALTFRGDYTVGAMRCNVEPASNLTSYRVRCGKPEEKQLIAEKAEFELYSMEGEETQTNYILLNAKPGKEKTFVFKTGETGGTFTDAGKTVKVTAIKIAENETEDERGAGELNVGKTESAIVYVGPETGDYAAYCFKTDSEVGRAIMKVCKDGDQCEVMGEIDYTASCKVEGLEATLSSAGRILKVGTVKKLIKK